MNIDRIEKNHGIMSVRLYNIFVLHFCYMQVKELTVLGWTICSVAYCHVSALAIAACYPQGNSVCLF